MPIDHSIALQGRMPQFEGPLDVANKAQSLRQMMQQGKMADMQMQQAVRQQNEERTLADLYLNAMSPDGNVDQKKLLGGLASQGLGARIPGVQKTFLDLDDKRTDIKKKNTDIAETESKKKAIDYDLVTKNLGAARQSITGLKNLPGVTAEHVIGEAQRLISSGIADKNTAEQILAGMPSDPSQLRAWLSSIEQQMLTSEQRMMDERARIQQAETARHNRAGEQHQRVMESQGERGLGLREREITANAGKNSARGVSDLRKEFNLLPEVKSYKQVLPIIESLRRVPNTTAGDLDLIYGVGKIMDPESVVREGEMTLVIKSGSPAERMRSYWTYATGGGRLTPKMRAELMDVLNSRTKGLEDNYMRSKNIFERNAEERDLPKDQIFVDIPSGGLNGSQSAPTGIDALLKKYGQ